MNNPLISVVITNYNYGQYLEQCIKSVLNQTFKEYEIIVVDDGSTDEETFYVLDSFREGIRYIRFSENRGLATAANEGIKASTGIYVMRLDADDWLEPDCLLRMYEHLNRTQTIAAVCSNYWEFDEETGQKRIISQNVTGSPHGSCMLINRVVFDSIGYYDEKLKHQDDFEFYLRLSHYYNVGFFFRALWFRRKHKGQMSTAFNSRMKARQEIMNIPKILIVIPARGNSKEVPNKNLREVNNIPLITRTIRIAKKSNIVSMLVVSTEDSRIAELAKKENVDVIDRPEILSKDAVSTIPVAIHAMNFVKDEYNYNPEIIISMQPTSPLLKPESLKKGLDKFIKNDYDSLSSVALVSKPHPYRTYELTDQGTIVPRFPFLAEKYLQRQDRPSLLYFTGGFYIRKRKLLENWIGEGFALGDTTGCQLVRPSEAIDIDTELDLTIANTLAIQSKEDL